MTESAQRSDPNQCRLPESTTAKHVAQSGFVAVANCIAVGLGVGVVGIGVCFVLAIALDFRPEVSLLAVLILIPLGLLASAMIPKRYFAKGAGHFRHAAIWGIRYLLIGAGIGLILQMLFGPGDICDASFVAFLGGAIGTMCGSVGGAFRGWLQTRRVAVLADAAAIGSILLGFAVSSLSGPPHEAYLCWASLVNISNRLQSYDYQHGHLPSATAIDPQSGQASSWRIEVYQPGLSTDTSKASEADYDYRKAWNDPRNLPLQRRGAWLFRYNQTDSSPVHNRGPYGQYTTFYKAITGPGTAFDSAGPASLRNLPKSLILVVRVERSDTHWMEPGDLKIEQLSPSEETKQPLLGKSGYAVVFADGLPWILSSRLPIEDLCRFFTIDGAAKSDREQFLGPYRVLPE
jgi:hypothetical protein